MWSSRPTPLRRAGVMPARREQALMPLIVTIKSAGVNEAYGWRVALSCRCIDAVRRCCTTDGRRHTARQIILKPIPATRTNPAVGPVKAAARDYRVLWCSYLRSVLGVELTIHNMAAIYYVDRFDLD